MVLTSVDRLNAEIFVIFFNHSSLLLRMFKRLHGWKILDLALTDLFADQDKLLLLTMLVE